MSMKVNRAELVAALKKAKAVAAGGGIMMLKSVRIASFERPDGDGIEIAATDQHETLVTEIGGEAGAGEAFCGLVGPDRLLAVLGADPGKEVGVGEKDGKLVVKGLARSTFPLEDAELYPTLPAAPAGGIEIEEETAAAIRRASAFAATEKQKYQEQFMNVFLWEEGGLLAVGATEGHVLWAEYGLAAVEAGFALAIPAETAKRMEACRLVLGEGHIFFVRGREEVSVRKGENDDSSSLRGLLGRTKREEGVSFRPEALLAPLAAVSARIDKENTTREWLSIKRRPEDEGAILWVQGLNGEAEVAVEILLPELLTSMPGQLIAAVKALAEVVEGEEEIEMAGWKESYGVTMAYKDRARVLLTGLKAAP